MENSRLIHSIIHLLFDTDNPCPLVDAVHKIRQNYYFDPNGETPERDEIISTMKSIPAFLEIKGSVIGFWIEPTQLFKWSVDTYFSGEEMSLMCTGLREFELFMEDQFGPQDELPPQMDMVTP
tara:strand:+ start:6775 stop:7143 length:369 start_codon:yes stop_codon:yes gene_type:complete